MNNTLLNKMSKTLIHEDQKKISNKAVQSFVKQCVTLAWKLQLQRPPMKLDDKTGLSICPSAHPSKLLCTDVGLLVNINKRVHIW